jgi:CRISPR-associated endoribonuclease Cas6
MRLTVVLEAPSPFFLPWDYPERLRGVVYSALRRWGPGLAAALHNQGLVAGGRRYKPFTYSWLWPRAVSRQKDGLLMEPPVRWWISSPLAEVLEGVVAPFLAAGKVEVGGALTISLVEVEGTPDLTPPVVLETLAPIVASTGGEWKGRFQKVFLEPWDEDFHRVLTQNLRNKAQALGERVSEDAWVRLEPLGVVRSRLVKVRDTAVRGFEGRYRALGDPLLLRVGYEMGFGERNGQGFGMVQVAGG